MPRKFALFLVILSAFLVAVSAQAESTEITKLRFKAVKGNIIAQYNLGLAYIAGDGVETDLAEAYLWLSIAAENGSTGRALQSLIADMTPEQLSDGRKRLAEYRVRTGTVPVAKPAQAAPTGPGGPGGPEISMPGIPGGSQPAKAAMPGQGGSPVPSADGSVISASDSEARSKLSQDLALAKRDNDFLQTNLASALNARDAANAELAASTSELATLRATLAKLQDTQPDSVAGTVEAAALNKELTQSQAAVAALTARVRQLETATTQRSRDLETAQAALTAANDRVAALSKTQDELQGALAARDAAESERTKLATALAATQQDLAETQNNLAAAQQTAATPDPKATAELAALTDQITGLKTRLAAAQSAQSVATDKVAELTRDLANTQAELERSKIQTTAQPNQRGLADAAALDKLNNELELARQEADQLKQNLTDAQAAREADAAKLAASTGELATLRTIVARLQNARAASSADAAKISELNTEVARLQAAGAALENNNRELVATAAQRSRSLEDTQAALTAANDRVAALSKTQDELQGALAARDAAENERTKLATALAATQQDLAETQNNLAAAQQTAATPDPKATAELAALTDQITGLKTRLAAAQSAQTEATDKVAEMTRDLAATKAQLDRSQSESSKQREQLATAQNELRRGADELATLRVTVTKLQSMQAAQESGKIASLQSELESLQAAANALRADNQALEKSATESDRNLEATRTQLAAARARIADLAQSESTLQAKLSRQTASANQAASVQITELTAALNAAKSEAATANQNIAQQQTLVEQQQQRLAVLQQELTEGQGKLTASEDQIRHLQTRLAAIAATPAQPDQETTTRLAALNEKVEALTGQVTDLNSRLAKAQTARTDAESTVTRLTRELATNREEFARSKSEYETRLNERIVADEAAQKKLSGELALAWNEENLLKKKLAALQSERDAALADKVQLAASLSAIQQEFSEAQSNLSAAQKAATAPDPKATAQLATLNEQITGLKTRLAATQSALTEATDKVNAQNQVLASTQQELASNQARLNERVTADETERNKLNEELARVRQEADALRAELATAQGAREEAAAALAKSTSELADLNSQVAQLQRAQTTRASAGLEITDLKKEVRRLQTVATALGEHNQQLEDAAALRGRTLDETKSALSAANTRIAALSQNQEDLNRALAAREAAETELAGLSTALAAAREELVAAQSALQSERTGSSQQKATIKQTEDKVTELVQQLAAARAKTPATDSVAQEKISELTELLDREKSSRAEAVAQLDSLSSDLGSARAQVARLQMEQNDLKARLQSATQPVQSDPADRTRIATLESELQQTRDQLAQVQSVAAKTTEHTDQLSELNGVIVALKSDLARAQNGRTEADRQLQSISAQLEGTQRKLNDVETQLAASAAEAKPAGASVDAAEFAAVQSKLSTTLRSYTILEQENDRIKANAAQMAARLTTLESQLAGATSDHAALNQQLDSSAAIATQVDPLREQLRLTADQLSSLRRENAELRTRLAVIIPPPSSNLASPTRPGSATAATVIAQAVNPQPAGPPEQTQTRVHTVVPGDTLSGIAARYYGTSTRWPEIFAANRAALPNERALRVGMQIVIP